MDAAIAWFQGHAYDLNLLGNFLAKCTADHAISRWRDVLLVKEDLHMHPRMTKAGSLEGHGVRMLRAYERWLGPKSATAATLRLLGLFDRPARSELLEELRAEPAIPGLTDALAALSEEEWTRTLGVLQGLGLIVRNEAHSLRNTPGPLGRSKPRSRLRTSSYFIDAHPLLREHFGTELREGQIDVWRAAHRRLYEYLRDTTQVPLRPAVDDLQPLFEAVAHGCKAGVGHEAFWNVYYERIQHRNDYYATNVLGLFSSDLSALASFFPDGIDQPEQSLDKGTVVILLRQTAYSLRAVGRLQDAEGVAKSALKIAMTVRDPFGGDVIAAGLVSQIELSLGKIADAEISAKLAVRLARESQHINRQISSRCYLAAALICGGKRQAAARTFLAAETLQKQSSPNCPYLHSTQGFAYHDLLLMNVERAAWASLLFPEARPVVSARRKLLLLNCDEVERQASLTPGFASDRAMSIISSEITNLTLGRTALYRWLIKSTSHRCLLETLKLAQEHLDRAVGGIRQAGQQQFVPCALISRSWLRCLFDDRAGADRDLVEAEEIAEHGLMKLNLADVHLQRARLFHDKAELPKARAIIECCGYMRRKKELEDTERAAKRW